MNYFTSELVVFIWLIARLFKIACALFSTKYYLLALSNFIFQFTIQQTQNTETLTFVLCSPEIKISKKNFIVLKSSKFQQLFDMISTEIVVKAIISSAIESYASGLGVHAPKKDNNTDFSNTETQKTLINALNTKISPQNVHLFNKNLGYILGKIAINIATLNYKVTTDIKGAINQKQDDFITELLELYKNTNSKPSITDYESINNIKSTTKTDKIYKDYCCFIDSETSTCHLLKLTNSEDLKDINFCSEKRHLLEQYCIQSEAIKGRNKIKIHIATTFDTNNEENSWQKQAQQFFATEELLNESDFWNFVCKSKNGHNIVLEEFERHSKLISKILKKYNLFDTIF